MIKSLIQKELLLIGRAKNGFLSMLVLMFCMVFIFHFSMEKDSTLSIEKLIGLKWAIIFLLSFVYLGQSNWEERESGAYKVNQLYVSFSLYFIIKSIVIWMVLSFLEVILILLFCLFFKEFSFSTTTFIQNLILLLPATLSLSFLGNTLSQISFTTRLKEIVLPMLMIPLSLPLLIFGMEAERKYIVHISELNISLGIQLGLCVFYASIGVLSEEVLKE